MNDKTLERLKKNPFYKLSNAQKYDAPRREREPMTEIGVVDKHDNGFDRHPTSLRRVERVSVNKVKKSDEQE